MITDISFPRTLSPKLNAVRTVLIFRALKLGDMLCSVPALRALRAGLPGARICLAGLPWARGFAGRFQAYIDEFIEFPGYPGLPEQPPDPGRWHQFVSAVRNRRFDLAVQMHGSGEISNSIIASLGARFIAGFHPAGRKPPDPEWFAPYPETLPEVDRNLALMRFLGIPDQGERLEFPFLETDRAALFSAPALNCLRPRSYVCLHPGASSPGKRWPLENFAAVARIVLAAGHSLVITGNRQESDLAVKLREMLQAPVIDAASPDLPLGGLALLIRDSRFLVCNDTGVSHLASALRVPSIVVFTAGDPARWAPRDRALHVSIGGKGQKPSVAAVARAVAGFLR